MQGEFPVLFPQDVIHGQLVRSHVTVFPGNDFLEVLSVPLLIQHQRYPLPMDQVVAQLSIYQVVVKHHHQRPFGILITAEGEGLGHHQLLIRPLVLQAEHILAVYLAGEVFQQLLIAFAAKHAHGSVTSVIRRHHHLVHHHVFPFFKEKIDVFYGGVEHGIIRQRPDIQIHIIIILFLPDLAAQIPQLRGIADIASHIPGLFNTPVHLQRGHIQRSEHLFLLHGQKQAGSRKINNHYGKQRRYQDRKIGNQQIHGQLVHSISYRSSHSISPLLFFRTAVKNTRLPRNASDTGASPGITFSRLCSRTLPQLPTRPLYYKEKKITMKNRSVFA